MQVSSFPLSSDDATLLLMLKRFRTLEGIAKNYQRDTSVISRRFKDISFKAAVLVKEEGQWKLTDLGLEMANWAQESIQQQQAIMSQKQLIRIATTRQFAALKLAPSLASILDLTKYRVELLTTDEGVESLLLSDKADIALDCGAPYSPDIAFKSVAKEDMGIVCTKQSLKLSGRPENYIHYERNSLNLYFEITQSLQHPFITCNDISSIKSLILAHQGWSILPFYTVDELVRGKKLIWQSHSKIKQLQFGVLWPRKNKRFEVVVDRCLEWLKKQNLQARG